MATISSTLVSPAQAALTAKKTTNPLLQPWQNLSLNGSAPKPAPTQSPFIQPWQKLSTNAPAAKPAVAPPAQVQQTTASAPPAQNTSAPVFNGSNPNANYFGQQNQTPSQTITTDTPQDHHWIISQVCIRTAGSNSSSSIRS